MIEKRDNGTYRVRIYRRGRYVASRTFNRKADAQAWERRQMDALAAGTWVRPADAEVTISTWVEQWWAARHPVKPSTAARYRSLLDNHVLPTWGRRPLTSIGRLEVATWARELAEKRSASTARQATLLLRQALQVAMDDGLIQRNPASGVRLPKVSQNEPRPLTHDQLWTLAYSLDIRDRALLLVMGYGGLRWGEAVALRRRDFGTGSARIRLTEAATEVGGGVVVGSLKDHESRTVALPPSAAHEVHSHVKTFKTPNELIFGTSTGTFLRNGNWKRDVLRPATIRLDLPPITAHNLRDTAATLAIESGASVVAVARLLGHETPSTTLRHYAGYFPDDLDALVKRTDKHARTAQQKAAKRDTET